MVIKACSLVNCSITEEMNTVYTVITDFTATVPSRLLIYSIQHSLRLLSHSENLKEGERFLKGRSLKTILPSLYIFLFKFYVPWKYEIKEKCYESLQTTQSFWSHQDWSQWVAWEVGMISPSRSNEILPPPPRFEICIFNGQNVLFIPLPLSELYNVLLGAIEITPREKYLNLTLEVTKYSCLHFA